jgi:hypothetical protein
METGAIIAVTTHGGAAADTATVEATVIEAGAGGGRLVTAEPPEGKCQVHDCTGFLFFVGNCCQNWSGTKRIVVPTRRNVV